MSEHLVTIARKRESPDFTCETDDRDHDWTFDAGITVRAEGRPMSSRSDFEEDRHSQARRATPPNPYTPHYQF